MSKTSLLKQVIAPTKTAEKTYRILIVAAFFLCAIASVCFLLHYLVRQTRPHAKYYRISLDLSSIEHSLIEEDAELALAKNPNCSHWDCFNVYKCGHRDQERIAIYVYPLQTYTDSQGTSAFTLSKEFYYMLKAIVESPYYTPNPQEACIFVPSIDVLNQNKINVNLVSKALASLT